MKKILSVLILFVSTLIFAQEAKESKWVLKVNAVQLLDMFSYPTLQISAERKINPYFSINAEIGYQLYDLSKADTILLKTRGFKTNIEGRLYLLKLLNTRTESKRNEIYVGLQLFHRENQNTNIVSYSLIDDSTVGATENFGTKRKATGFNVTLGNQISVSKKFVLEPFVGFGSMRRKIENTDLEYDKTKHEVVGTDIEPLVKRLNLEESSGNVFNFCFGLRVGYRL
ncbi:DUF3575 domain-containing protein [Chryseobacterium foetidum]|uniref:DUF3575 domain-containing protein n=1 Tax=Chryseobacterium foetidum TaxID=2951057 RepID=UPI0021C96411|nr:DUF3575 domain-containing protein [Chryseobacterium foetidum]